MTPAEAAKDPPPRLFPKRLKGYFKVPVLSRVTCLRCFVKIGRRGEFMTQWHDPETGVDYDGSIYFAHAFSIFYLSDMAPACSVVFKDPGYIYSSSNMLKLFRKFVTCLFYVFAHVSLLTFLCAYTQYYLGESYGFVS